MRENDDAFVVWCFGFGTGVFASLIIFAIFAACPAHADSLTPSPGVPANVALCLDQAANKNCLKSDGTNTAVTTAKRIDIGPIVTNDFFGTTLATQINTASPGNTIWHILDTTTATNPKFQLIWSGVPLFATNSDRYLSWIWSFDRGTSDHATFHDPSGNDYDKCQGWTDGSILWWRVCRPSSQAGLPPIFTWGNAASNTATALYNYWGGGTLSWATMRLNLATSQTGDAFQVYAGDGTTKLFAVASTGAISSAVAVTVPNGGTGAGTFTAHGVLLGEGTGAVTPTAVGATGTVLRGATGADPAFGAVNLTTDVTGALPTANGGTGATSLTGANIPTRRYIAAYLNPGALVLGTAAEQEVSMSFTVCTGTPAAPCICGAGSGSPCPTNSTGSTTGTGTADSCAPGTGIALGSSASTTALVVGCRVANANKIMFTFDALAGLTAPTSVYTCTCLAGI